MLPKRVEITEVGTRDGFQAESEYIPTATKIDVINRLMGDRSLHSFFRC